MGLILRTISAFKRVYIKHIFINFSQGQHKDPIAAARYYEKSIRISGSLEVLKLLDSLPQTDDMIRELNIKSHNHLLKVHNILYTIYEMYKF